MNTLSLADFTERLKHRVQFRLRKLDVRTRAAVFSSGDDPGAIRQIHVINLDRRPDRWRRLRRELDRFSERRGERLSSLVRRFSAIDARYLESDLDSTKLIPSFTLAEQLMVDPNPLLRIDDESRAIEINMTREEVAIALSHIGVWQLIAEGNVPSALVLEDDVFMSRGFTRALNRTWSALETTKNREPDFDLLYLSFREVGDTSSTQTKQPVRRPRSGIWQASGYVLSREGARKLLDRFPVHGPVDLWLNLQFENLRVFTAARPIIEQRLNEPSTNSYSVLPVLSQVGVITRERPLVATTKQLRGPVIAVGSPGSGLTALAKALSMIGYTCCSDLDYLPEGERRKLFKGQRNRSFNAYVNIAVLDSTTFRAIAKSNPGAKFIITSQGIELPEAPPDRVLRLDASTRDKWEVLSAFLQLQYPSLPYPSADDIGIRSENPRRFLQGSMPSKNLKCDRSPWILRCDPAGVNRLSVKPQGVSEGAVTSIDWASGELLDHAVWKLRDDTFPSNLALFTPDNFSQRPGKHAKLTLRNEPTRVRGFSSAAIASRESYLYGTFKAELQPTATPGLITGLFLHRNAPRQEIDIEFLGKDTTKMLVNVFYNPGPEGTKLEYGYRGTPTLIDLGFDASAQFHTYEIVWEPHVIQWRVDGTVVYERTLWNPTPIPDQPLEFNVNLWYSRSSELAGRLAPEFLPASIEIRFLEVRPAAQTPDRPRNPQGTSVFPPSSPANGSLLPDAVSQ